MVSWPPDWQQRLIEALTGAGADRPCPRCGHEDFQLLDGYIGLAVQAKLGEGPSGSHTTIGTVCERCGYLSQHLVNVLLAKDIDQSGGESSGGGPNGQ
jgi:ribosomal protein L37E